MESEAAARVDFSRIRYGQVWEDADVLLEALDVRPGEVCLSIASAGDNALALLAKNPARVIAIDLNPAQIACLELRVAAYRELAHPELLELLGSRPSIRRAALYRRCRSALSDGARSFWDARSSAVERGIGSAGKFERYFEVFRTRVLPLVHDRQTVDALLRQRVNGERLRFYEAHWDSWRWRLLFKVFFSRRAMGWLGRDPGLFRYVDTDVAARILARTKEALAERDVSENPHVHWILTGAHGATLPFALREENFEAIRDNLDRLSWHCVSLESYLAGAGTQVFDRFNLSDVFEYVSEAHYHRLLAAIVRSARPGARLVYWNLLVPRRRPDVMADRLESHDALAHGLHRRDRAFFYSALRIEEVR